MMQNKDLVMKLTQYTGDNVPRGIDSFFAVKDLPMNFDFIVTEGSTINESVIDEIEIEYNGESYTLKEIPSL